VLERSRTGNKLESSEVDDMFHDFTGLNSRVMQTSQLAPPGINSSKLNTSNLQANNDPNLRKSRLLSNSNLPPPPVTPAKVKDIPSKHYKNSIGAFIGFLSSDKNANKETGSKNTKSGQLQDSNKKSNRKKSSRHNLNRKDSNSKGELGKSKRAERD
jgi:hypothetical protein